MKSRTLILYCLNTAFELPHFMPDFLLNTVNIPFVVFNLNFYLILKSLHVLGEKPVDYSLDFTFINFLGDFRLLHVHV